jgi:hypothetical protein
MAGINAIIYLLATLPTWYLVDRWGRRTILLSGAVIVSGELQCHGGAIAKVNTDGCCADCDWLVHVY